VLLFERPLKIGDWIQLGESNGRVVETNWRAVHLLTRSKDLIIIPNSVLAKGSFINFSRPAALHRETISIQFSRNDPPSKVMRVLGEAISAVQFYCAEGQVEANMWTAAPVPIRWRCFINLSASFYEL
jgi:small-conductance mechanosensitive channel